MYRSRHEPADRRTLWLALAAAVVLAAAAFAAFKLLPGLGRPTAQSPTAPPSTPTSTPVPTGTLTGKSTPTTTPVTSVGLVTADPGVAGDPRAPAVASMLNGYFTAVNNRDFPSALSLYDPAGVVNPTNPAQANAFARALSTTTDSQVRLLGITTDTSGRGAVQAAVTLRSRQDPGFGPRPNTNETCTDWTLTYTLTQRDSDGYLILSSTGTHATCA
jgi:hypothetical protein